MKKAVITGLGIESPAGSSDLDVLHSIKKAQCPVKPIPEAKVPPGQSAVGATITSTSTTSGRAIEILLKSCANALNLDILQKNYPPADCAVIVGTSLGDIDSAIESYMNGNDSSGSMENPSRILNAPHNLAQIVSSTFNLKGPKVTLSCACTSGTSGMGLALDWIRLGRIKRCLVSAVDTINDFVLCGFSSLWALTTSPPKPFDTARTGMALGETAVSFLVEAVDNDSLEQTATIRAYIEGYGASCDAVHITAPDRSGAGAERAIKEAIKDANWNCDDVDYLNVHATGSLYNDSMILKAIESLFGERAHSIPISSVNPCTGHTLGAAGLAELYATIIASENSFIPPTPNLTAPEREDMNLVTGEALHRDISRSISLTTGFGGSNTAIAVRVENKTSKGR